MHSVDEKEPLVCEDAVAEPLPPKRKWTRSEKMYGLLVVMQLIFGLLSASVRLFEYLTMSVEEQAMQVLKKNPLIGPVSLIFPLLSLPSHRGSNRTTCYTRHAESLEAITPSLLDSISFFHMSPIAWDTLCKH